MLLLSNVPVRVRDLRANYWQQCHQFQCWENLGAPWEGKMGPGKARMAQGVLQGTCPGGSFIGIPTNRCGKSSRTSVGIKPCWLKFKITSHPAFPLLQKGILQPSQIQQEHLVTRFDEIPASLAAEHIFKALPPGVRWSWEKNLIFT